MRGAEAFMGWLGHADRHPLLKYTDLELAMLRNFEYD